MAYDNRPNLSCRQFIQETGDTFIFSGSNYFCGILNSQLGYQINCSPFFYAGNGSTSIRVGCNANTNSYSVALGFYSCAMGIRSISIGCGSGAYGYDSLSIGNVNVSCGKGSSILGGHDNIICSNVSGATLIGNFPVIEGNTYCLDNSTYSNYAVVPNLAILNIPSGTGCYLCVDSFGKIGKTAGGSISISSIEKITKTITQSSHGFSCGCVIGFSGGTYNLPIADGTYNGEVLGIVSKCCGTNSFELTMAGYVTGLTGLVANCTYFLSDAAYGSLTYTKPTIVGHIVKSVIAADSASSGWVLPYPAYLLSVSSGGTGSGITWNGSTSDGIATYVDATHVCSEPNLTFDGSLLNVTGCLKTSDKIVVGGLTNVHNTALIQGKIDTTLDYQRYLFFKDEANTICFALANGGGGTSFFPIFTGQVTCSNPALYFLGNSVTGTSVGTGIVTFEGRINNVGTTDSNVTLFNFTSGYGVSKAKIMADGTFCTLKCFVAPVIQLTSGATAGCVLTSDASGYGHWCTPSGGGDSYWSSGATGLSPSNGEDIYLPATDKLKWSDSSCITSASNSMTICSTGSIIQCVGTNGFTLQTTTAALKCTLAIGISTGALLYLQPSTNGAAMYVYHSTTPSNICMGSQSSSSATAAGCVLIWGGNNSSSGTAGHIYICAGSATNGAGGNINLVAGNSANSTDGRIIMTNLPAKTISETNILYINSSGAISSGATSGGGLDAYAALTSGATVTWDPSVGLHKTLNIATSFTLSLTNLANGMSGDLRINNTAPTSLTITLPTSKLSGSVTALTAGIYHLAWTYDGTNLDFNITSYI